MAVLPRQNPAVTAPRNASPSVQLSNRSGPTEATSSARVTSEGMSARANEGLVVPLHSLEYPSTPDPSVNTAQHIQLPPRHPPLSAAEDAAAPNAPYPHESERLRSTADLHETHQGASREGSSRVQPLTMQPETSGLPGGAWVVFLNHPRHGLFLAQADPDWLNLS